MKQITIGNEIKGSNYDPVIFRSLMGEAGHNPDGSLCPGHLLGSTQLIEDLRPKTPPRERDTSSSHQGSSAMFGEAFSPRGSWRRGRGGLSIIAPSTMMSEGYASPMGSPCSPMTVTGGMPGSPSGFYQNQHYAEESDMCPYYWTEGPPLLRSADVHGSLAAQEQQPHPFMDVDPMRTATISSATVTGSFLSYSKATHADDGSFMWPPASHSSHDTPVFQGPPLAKRGRRQYYYPRGRGSFRGGRGGPF